MMLTLLSNGMGRVLQWDGKYLLCQPAEEEWSGEALQCTIQSLIGHSVF